MSVVVLGTQQSFPDPGGPQDSSWERMRMTLTGGGETITLTGRQNVFIERAGIEGLHMPPMEHEYDELATLPGAYFRRTQIKQRKPYLEVYLFHDGSTEGMARWETSFWNVLNPRRPVRWTVEVPGVSTRHLDMRMAPGGSWKPEMDPTYFGVARYGIDFNAEDTGLWYETPQPVRFLNRGAMPFHGGLTEGAPIINIGSGIESTKAYIDNPGDEDTYGVWRINGPAPQAVVGVGGRVIEVPFAIGAGDWLELNANPREHTAFDQDGNDRFEELGEADFAEVPPGRVELTVNLFGGTGFVDFDRKHYFYRAYGKS